MFRGNSWVLVAAIGVSALLSLGLGNFTPEVVPDSGGYLDLAPWPDLLSAQRTPFYGWFIALLTAGGGDFALVPVVQFLGLAAATLLLFAAAKAYGASDSAALALTLPIPFGNAALLFINDVHPEILAISLVLVALACVLALCRDRLLIAALLGLLVSLGAAYLLKPAFLMFIPAMPLMAVLLLRLNGTSWRGTVMRAGLIAVVAALPFLTFASLRHSVTGSFQVVSFGGAASSGMSGLMVRPQTVDRLPAEHRALAAHIIEKRDELAAQGIMLPIPLNSTNERSFPSAALGYFDVLARSYDDVVFKIVLAAPPPSETWVAFDRRLQSFTAAVVKAEPVYYAAWVIGATTRFIGLITVANATFATAALGLIGLFLVKVLRGNGADRGPVAAAPRDWAILVVIVATYTLANYLPSVLMTFPARRYVDTAGLLLAALPILGLQRLWRHPSLSRGTRP